MDFQFNTLHKRMLPLPLCQRFWETFDKFRMRTKDDPEFRFHEPLNERFKARKHDILRCPGRRNQNHRCLPRLPDPAGGIGLIIGINLVEQRGTRFHEFFGLQAVKLFRLADFRDVVRAGTKNRIIMIKGTFAINHVRADQRMKKIDMLPPLRRTLDVKLSKVRHGHDQGPGIQLRQKTAEQFFDVEGAQPAGGPVKNRVPVIGSQIGKRTAVPG